MKSPFPVINPKKECEKIGKFISDTLKTTGMNNLTLGLSGGIDSATSLYLARQVLPAENIFVAHLFYFHPSTSSFQNICFDLKIPPENQYFLSIKKPVDELIKALKINDHLDNGRVRVGNVMARIRMIFLFDLAKKHRALVCGTENKSEHLLGYYTRFGDAASDIEPITHLYKTQIYDLARYLKIPPEVINAKPSAGLWSDQTDEGEFGFSYREADQVLFRYFELKIPPVKIKLNFPNAEKIIKFAGNNNFKKEVPYKIT